MALPYRVPMRIIQPIRCPVSIIVPKSSFRVPMSQYRVLQMWREDLFKGNP